MPSLTLDFYGTTVEIAGPGPVVEELGRDFRGFRAGRAGARLLSWVLEPVSFPQRRRPAGRPDWSWKGWEVHERPERRIMLAADGSGIIFEERERRFELFAGEPGRLHELAYLGILSRVGEALDEAGLHRIHAFGFERLGEGGLLLLPSGGGKSRLALETWRSGRLRWLSEESPLIDRDLRILAFPTRWAFRSDADLSDIEPRHVRVFHRAGFPAKRVIDLEPFLGSMAWSASLRWLLIGRPGRGGASIKKADRTEALAALARHLVLGQGLAQMGEYMLGFRPRRVARLSSIALSRALRALSIIARAEIFRFDLSPDPGASAGVLLRFVEGSMGQTLDRALPAMVESKRSHGER
ncbi:MAG: hypothetical protein HY549_00445 [Elusimicrobia bacterium]|nr:hypothetical protein [Elusimicrobiota bacterium]